MSPSAITPPPEPASPALAPAPTTYCPPHMLESVNKSIDGTEYRAHNQAMPTNFRAMMNSGSLILGASTRYPSPDAARVVATLPHHFCFIDAEHMPVDATTMTHMIRTVNFTSGGRMVPLVRIPKSAPQLVAYALNAGAGGIVMPHVQNAEQARELVKLCRFPPLGHRGHPPATLFGHERVTGKPGQTIYDVWDDNICVICQIEDAEGVANIEEICAVEGVDALMVGTHDLRLELGITPRVTFDGDEPVFIDALEKITRAAEKRGPHGMAILGLSLMGSDFEKRVQRGWRAFIISIDSHIVHEHGQKDFEKAQALARIATRGSLGSDAAAGSLLDGADIELLKKQQQAFLPLTGSNGLEALKFV